MAKACIWERRRRNTKQQIVFEKAALCKKDAAFLFYDHNFTVALSASEMRKRPNTKVCANAELLYCGLSSRAEQTLSDAIVPMADE
jgi:hypothetical protein